MTFPSSISSGHGAGYLSMDNPDNPLFLEILEDFMVIPGTMRGHAIHFREDLEGFGSLKKTAQSESPTLDQSNERSSTALLLHRP